MLKMEKEKENYSDTLLNEAFKQLDELDEQMFDISDKGKVDELVSFVADDAQDEVTPVIDTNAEDEEDLKTSYVGDYILQCNTCLSLFYKSKDELKYNPDSQTFNEEDVCPVCGSTTGYTLIGKVASVDLEKEFSEGEEPEQEEPKLEPEQEVNPDDNVIAEDVTSFIKPLKEVDSTQAKYDPEDDKIGNEEETDHTLNKQKIIDKVKASLSKNLSLSSDDISDEEADNVFSDIISGATSEIIDKLDDKEEQEIKDQTTIDTKDDKDLGTVDVNLSTTTDTETTDTEEDTGDKDTSGDELEDNEVEVTDFDEDVFNNQISKALREQYYNVANFATTAVKDKGNYIVVEGVINFKAKVGNKVGNRKVENITLTPIKVSKDKAVFNGFSNSLSKFILEAKINNKNIIAESIKIK